MAMAHNNKNAKRSKRPKHPNNKNARWRRALILKIEKPQYLCNRLTDADPCAFPCKKLRHETSAPTSIANYYHMFTHSALVIIHCLNLFHPIWVKWVCMEIIFHRIKPCRKFLHGVCLSVGHRWARNGSMASQSFYVGVRQTYQTW